MRRSQVASSNAYAGDWVRVLQPSLAFRQPLSGDGMIWLKGDLARHYWFGVVPVTSAKRISPVANGVIDWLMSNGVVYTSEYYSYPDCYCIGASFLSQSDRERAWDGTRLRAAPSEKIHVSITIAEVP